MPDTIHGRRRWLALTVLCSGMVMIVIDGSVVYVALPSIRADLGFSETSLVWLVNAYILTFGGFQLLGGRLGDLYGARNVFLTGIVGFTLASLACGLATSQTTLIWARAVLAGHRNKRSERCRRLWCQWLHSWLSSRAC